MNFQVSYLKTPMLALAALASAPLVAIWSRNRKNALGLPGAAMASVMVIFAGIAMVTEPYTRERPRSVNLAYMQTTDADGATTAQWRLYTYGPEDKAYTAAAGFPAEPAAFSRFGGAKSKAYFQPAQNHNIASPSLSITSDEFLDGVRIIKGDIAAGRAGVFFGITFPAGTNAEEFSVNGDVLLNREKFASGKINQAYFNGFGARTLPFELRIAGDGPSEIAMFEVSPLPDDAKAISIIQKRPDSAAPLQFGDHAEVQHIYRF
ncbi:MAG: hypothetical protein DHS20C05_23470 [Hyphococcus sp.]|nr:MAG: hypothetical protein DHS20C05_23470 [Marinicaulis sp.]